MAAEIENINLLNGSASNSKAKNGGIDSPAFCVAVMEHGQIGKFYGKNPKEFCDCLDNANIAWVDYWANDFEKEAVEVAIAAGFSQNLISTILKSKLTAFEDFDTELGMMVPAIKVEKFNVNSTPLVILIKKNIVLTIHAKEATRFVRFRRYAETYLKKIPQSSVMADKLTMVLIRIIDENNSRNFDHLREIEEQGDQMNEIMLDPKISREKIGAEIYKMKHALIAYLDALWATFDVINLLRNGDSELITDNPKLLSRIQNQANHVNRQIELAEYMSTVLASGLEVLQSIYNNQLQILNNKLALVVAYLTVLGTAVLVPNTIATVMGSSAFDLKPSDQGWYIALLAISTIIATAITWWWVKSKNLIPKKIK